MNVVAAIRCRDVAAVNHLVGGEIRGSYIPAIRGHVSGDLLCDLAVIEVIRAGFRQPRDRSSQRALSQDVAGIEGCAVFLYEGLPEPGIVPESLEPVFMPGSGAR